MQNFQLFLAVNEGGNAAVSLESAEEARGIVNDEFGGDAIRVVRLSVAMELPVVPGIEVEVQDVREEVSAKEVVAA
jgi:hypothetical protein